MTRTRTVVTTAAALLLAVILAGCAGKPAGPSPSPTAAATASAGGSIPPAATRVGQAADQGTFAPLAVPASLSFGAGVTPAGFTPEGSHLQVGDLAVLDGQQCTMASAAGILISVDSISRPLEGPERDTALTHLGFSTTTRQVAQKIVLRLRQYAGYDVGSGWKLMAGVHVLNYGLHESMPIYAPAGNTPLDGHGALSGDTVQITLYAVGTPDELAGMPLESVELVSGCDRQSSHSVLVNSPYLGELAGE